MSLDALRREMSSLFSVCLPADIASRFSQLLGSNPKRWSKIDPWRVWQQTGSASVVEWKGDVSNLLISSRLSMYSCAEATVLRCGHDKPLLRRLPLRQALIGESAVFEGFVSIVPDKLGLAINHDGMLCLILSE